MLIAAGVMVASIHEVWRWRLGLPGHFGLVWMAAAIFVRCESKHTWAALLVGSGVTGSTLVFGLDAHSLLKAPLYLFTGLLLDVGARVWPQLFLRAWSASLAAGVSFLAKPVLIAAGVAGFGLHAGMLRHGYVFPFVTHFCFGMVGGMIGYWLWRSSAGDGSES